MHADVLSPTGASVGWPAVEKFRRWRNCTCRRTSGGDTTWIGSVFFVVRSLKLSALNIGNDGRADVTRRTCDAPRYARRGVTSPRRAFALARATCTSFGLSCPRSNRRACCVDSTPSAIIENRCDIARDRARDSRPKGLHPRRVCNLITSYVLTGFAPCATRKISKLLPHTCVWTHKWTLDKKQPPLLLLLQPLVSYLRVRISDNLQTTLAA